VANWIFAETTHIVGFRMMGDLQEIILSFEFYHNRSSDF